MKVIIVGCGKDGKVLIPGGQDCFEAGDSVIVVTTATGLQDIHEILSVQGRGSMS